tara:strand:+ start:137735 stop:138187 length:453 start_codon:yes stop_codon:yes gene_type:complete
MKILKTLLTLVLSIGLFACGSVNGEKVPYKIKDAFQKKFPTATSINWDKESNTEWEAEFKMNKLRYSANFLEDGTWKETEHEISKKEIPQNIKNVLMAEFLGYEIEEAEISETKDGVFFEFEIEKNKFKMEVVIDENANIINNNTDKEKD